MFNKLKLITMSGFILFMLITICNDSNADIYKWQDAQGKIHFSDTPPAEESGVLKIQSEPSPPPKTTKSSPYRGSGSNHLNDATPMVNQKESCKSQPDYGDIHTLLSSYQCTDSAEVERLLIKMTDQGNSPYDRGIAADQLGQIKDICAARALTFGLCDQLPVAESVKRSLSRLDQIAATPLIDVLEETSFPQISRERATDLLTQLHTLEKRELERLTNLLQHGMKDQQLMAANALYLKMDLTLTPIWMEMLENPNPKIVEKSALALKRLKDKRALPYLWNALNNLTDKELEDEILMAFIMTDPQYSLKMISPGFDKRSPFFKKTAVTALGRAGDPATFKFIANCLKDKDESVRNNAINAISRFQSPEAVALLIDMLDDTSPGNIDAAKNGLHGYGMLAGMQLIQAFDNESEEIRRQSAKVIYKNIQSPVKSVHKIKISGFGDIADQQTIKEALIQAFKQDNLAVVAGAALFFCNEKSSLPLRRERIISTLQRFGDEGMANDLYCRQDDPVIKEAAAAWYHQNIKNGTPGCLYEYELHLLKVLKQ